MRILILGILLSSTICAADITSGRIRPAPSFKRILHKFCQEYLIADDPDDMMKSIKSQDSFVLFHRYLELKEKMKFMNPTWAQMNEEAKDALELRLIEQELGIEAATY